MTDSPLSLVWLRRDLRLHDHAALCNALKAHGNVQPVFVFDTDILRHFPNPADRRVSFIARTLVGLHDALKARGGGLLVLHAGAADAMPLLAEAAGAKRVVAAEDYEPGARVRDKAVADALKGRVQVQFVKDQVLFAPGEIVRGEGEPYKVYTPYANAWRAQLTPLAYASCHAADAGRYADLAHIQALARERGLRVLDADSGAEAMLEAIGYEPVRDELWQVSRPQARLETFITFKSADYPLRRDMVAIEGTSRLSPYLRFGLLSVRECIRAAVGAKADKWLSELIWREFYAMILFHFPESATAEWNPRYRGRLAWNHDDAVFARWQKGQTGYPLVDAAMRQLLADGWMHNRARMVVASFLTKHLQTDWRLGEAHFAQYLMDYDMASNVGGWQWAASTGTDAQPYFRVFNPVLQSEKFDPKGDYIRTYVPELRGVDTDAIHAPWVKPLLAPYIPPLVDHATARLKAIEMFKAS